MQAIFPSWTVIFFAVLASALAGTLMWLRISGSTVWWTDLIGPGRVAMESVNAGGWQQMRILWSGQQDFPAILLLGALNADPMHFPLTAALATAAGVLLAALALGLRAGPALLLAAAIGLWWPLGWLPVVLPLCVLAAWMRNRRRIKVENACLLVAAVALFVSTPTLFAAALVVVVLGACRLPAVFTIVCAFLGILLQILHPLSLGFWPPMARLAAGLAGAMSAAGSDSLRWQERVMRACGIGVACALFPPAAPLALLTTITPAQFPRLWQNAGWLASTAATLVAAFLSLHNVKPARVRASLEAMRELASISFTAAPELMLAGREEARILGWMPELARRLPGFPDIRAAYAAHAAWVRSPESPSPDAILLAGAAGENALLLPNRPVVKGLRLRAVTAGGALFIANPTGGELILPEAKGQDPVMLSRLAAWLDAAGDTAAARRLMDAALEMDDKPEAEVLLRRARHFMRLQRQGEALEETERALAREPDNPAALSMRAQLLYGAKDFSNAYDASARLVEVTPDDAAALWLHARISNAVKLARAEIEALERLIQIKRRSGQDATVEIILLGQVHARDGDAKRALARLEEAAKSPTLTDPQRQQIRENISAIRKRAGLPEPEP